MTAVHKGRRAMLAVLAAAMVVAACGGGGADGGSTQAGRGNAAVLGKYQGTFSEQCAMPIDFGTGGFGPASQRETLVFTAPDASGAVSVQSIIELFSTTLVCYDRVSQPYAVITRLASSRILWIESFAAGTTVTGIPIDVVSSYTPAVDIQVSGDGVTREVLNGIDVWRITFPDGKSVVVDRRIPAVTVEVALSAFNVNGVPNAEIVLDGNITGSYQKIGP
jgi:hypothetical protein